MPRTPPTKRTKTTSGRFRVANPRGIPPGHVLIRHHVCVPSMKDERDAAKHRGVCNEQQWRAGDAFAGSCTVYYAARGGFGETPTCARAAWLAGNKIKGPAVSEEYASSTILNPGDAMETDGLGNLVITIGREKA